MRHYFFGDIHGNPYALDACLHHASTINADLFCCLGDIVGWLPWGKTVLERIMAMNILCVAGNHDLMVIGAITDNPNQIDRMQATAYNAGTLWNNKPCMDYLENLPLKLEYPHFTVLHHSPFELPESKKALHIDNFSYIDKSKLNIYASMWQTINHPLVFSGHDHIPMILVFHDDGGSEIIPVPLHAKEWGFELQEGVRYWIKAGSVGGPYRDGVPVANALLYDDVSNILVFYKISYKTSELIEGLREHKFFRNISTIQRYIRTVRAWQEC